MQIIKAALKLWIYAGEWREAVTCTICKPGKASYDVPYKYRLIALLNTIAKMFSAIIAEEITYVAEKFQLLLANHFGKRLGQSTTD